MTAKKQIAYLLPSEMEVDEIHSRIDFVKKRMRSAANNFEFYYYEELKEELHSLKKELINREKLATASEQ